MDLIDLKKDPQPIDSNEMYDEPMYSYGLCTSLGREELEKLGIEKLPEVIATKKGQLMENTSNTQNTNLAMPRTPPASFLNYKQCVVLFCFGWPVEPPPPGVGQ